jgi:hypothetical protein
MNDQSIAIILIICMLCSMSSIFGVGIYIYFGKREGDKCEGGDDENGVYAIGKNLKCSFIKCKNGYKLGEGAMCRKNEA